eukprot:6749912-Alexandrium_andersonii.AAC.1
MSLDARGVSGQCGQTCEHSLLAEGPCPQSLFTVSGPARSVSEPGGAVSLRCQRGRPRAGREGGGV